MRKQEGVKIMRNRKSMMVIGVFILMVCALLFAIEAADAAVFYGKVVATEVKSIQVQGDDGRVSVFWVGRHTHLTSRHPLVGDRVKITYIKDHLRRNAATRITILR
jgi:flavin reductase (DIM6/NTAB) family NADH-FMN oxidoreductase RutF